jgi:hypothetical protein
VLHKHLDDGAIVLLGGKEECGRADKIAGIYRGATREKQLHDIRVPGLGGAGECHAAQAVASFERGAVIEEAARKIDAAFVSGQPKHVVDLDGAGSALDLIVGLLLGLAGPHVRVGGSWHQSRKGQTRKQYPNYAVHMTLQIDEAPCWDFRPGHASSGWPS